jgi:hypothetical protein
MWDEKTHVRFVLAEVVLDVMLKARRLSKATSEYYFLLDIS